MHKHPHTLPVTLFPSTPSTLSHTVTPSPFTPHWRPQSRGCEGVWLSRRAAPPPGGAAERHLQGGHGKIGMVTDNQPVMYMYTATTVSISKIGMATDNQPVSKTNLPQSCTYMYMYAATTVSITHQSNRGWVTAMLHSMLRRPHPPLDWTRPHPPLAPSDAAGSSMLMPTGALSSSPLSPPLLSLPPTPPTPRH